MAHPPAPIPDPAEVLYTLTAAERAAVGGLFPEGRVCLFVKDTLPHHRAAGVYYTGLPVEVWAAVLALDPAPWVVVYHRPPPPLRAKGAVGRMLVGPADALETRRDRGLEATLDREPLVVWRM